LSFTVYRSSAGSGKTFTLVKEYLKIALTDTQDPPQQYRRILAITFTNKAAAEMKARILKALKELGADDHSKISGGSKTLLDTLVNETGFSPDVLRERAGSVLSAILHNYSDFAIGTIDSFVHKVVRTFAFDLKLPVNFEIEMDAQKLLGEAVNILISRIGEEEGLTRMLIAFSEAKADDEKNWHIEDDLNKLARELLSEEGALQIARLKMLSISDFQSIISNLNAALAVFEKEIASHAQEAVLLLDSKQLGHAVFFQKERGIRKYFENLAKGKKDDFSPNSYVRKTIEEDKWTGASASASDISALESIKAKLKASYHGIQKKLEESLPHYRLIALVGKNIYQLAVLNEIDKILEEHKKENSILHISEFNKLIADIVFQEPIPFIYERLGTRYSNYLIDEFQDTSILQWQNLLPLVENALSEEQFTMIVGDGKQAIYRWRGGDVSQFANLPLIEGFEDNPVVREREDSLKRHYRPMQLESNFRSKAEIIQFNNALYREFADDLPDAYRRIYDKQEQVYNPANTGGCVSIEFFEEEKSELVAAHMKRISALLNQLIAEGFQYQDIALLFRTNKEGNVVASHLIAQGVPVLSNDSLLLKNSPAVNFMAATLRSLHNLQDDIARAEMIRFLTSRSKNTTLQEGLPAAVSPSAFRKYLEDSGFEYQPNQLLKLPLYQLCEEVMRIFNLHKTTDPYLVYFLDEILEFSGGKDNSLAAWQTHWEDRREKASAVVPSGMNAVNILTVHRSKGLEFPVVILPLKETREKPGKNSFWVEEKIVNGLDIGFVPNTESLKDTAFAHLYEEEQLRTRLDNLNLLYVATTRAEERLYVLCGNWKAERKATSTSYLERISAYLTKAGLTPDDHGRVLMGKETPHLKKANELNQESISLNSFISVDWQEKIRIRSAAREAWSEEQLQKQDRGVLIHTILSRIKTQDDIEKALESATGEGILAPEEFAPVKDLLQQLLALKELEPFFREGLTVKNEAEIILADGSACRPDRIVYTADKTIIIDYKTGKETPAHQQQIENYASILSSMKPGLVEKYLVYTDELKVLKC
jgi:ATP-dependent exoDNAse (exonuclease V) beta subunit